MDRPVAELSEYLGKQTNNYAEYSGLLAALTYALKHGFKALKVFSDSELMVKQIKGQYKVNNPALKELHGKARGMIGQPGRVRDYPRTAREEPRCRPAGEPGDGPRNGPRG